jgi:hypothetical protein
MAFGHTEDPGVNPVSQLDGVDYPVWREQLVKISADNGASADVINLFKCLPRGQYHSKDGVLRDLAEAARRFAMGNFPNTDDDQELNRDRRNIGRDAVEGTGPR